MISPFVAKESFKTFNHITFYFLIFFQNQVIFKIIWFLKQNLIIFKNDRNVILLNDQSHTIHIHINVVARNSELSYLLVTKRFEIPVKFCHMVLTVSIDVSDEYSSSRRVNENEADAIEQDFFDQRFLRKEFFSQFLISWYSWLKKINLLFKIWIFTIFSFNRWAGNSKRDSLAFYTSVVVHNFFLFKPNHKKHCPWNIVFER